MAQSEAEWLEQHAQRLLTDQKAEADRAKLLATFVAGIAATLVATALQVGSPANGLDFWAVVVLALCILATFAVVLLDRLRAPDHAKILAEKAINGWSDTYTLAQFRGEELAAVRFNVDVLRRVRAAVLFQSLCAFGSGALAAISLLIEGVR